MTLFDELMVAFSRSTRAHIFLVIGPLFCTLLIVAKSQIVDTMDTSGSLGALMEVIQEHFSQRYLVTGLVIWASAWGLAVKATWNTHRRLFR